MPIVLGVVFIQGCIPIQTNVNSVDVAPCNPATDYGLTFRAVYDISGKRDSFIQITCPLALSYTTYKIAGTDIKPVIKKEEINYLDLPCCLPF